MLSEGPHGWFLVADPLGNGNRERKVGVDPGNKDEL